MAAVNAHTNEIIAGDLPDEDVIGFGLLYSRNHPKYRLNHMYVDYKRQQTQHTQEQKHYIEVTEDTKHQPKRIRRTVQIQNKPSFSIDDEDDTIKNIRQSFNKRQQEKYTKLQCITEICKIDKLKDKLKELNIFVINEETVPLIGYIIKDLDKNGTFTQEEKVYIQNILENTDFN